MMGSTENEDSLEHLGFQMLPSPLSNGPDLVANNMPPTDLQYAAVIAMSCALLLALVTNKKHARFGVWALGLVASCVHNADNILRPGTYLTPAWIVKPYLFFPMEIGFVFWLVVMMFGVLALKTRSNKIPILLHSLGTSFGVMHYYVAQDLAGFSIFAHITILFEVVMGVVVGVKLLLWRSEVDSQNYQNVQSEERPISVEMPKRYNGLRQRSRSPHVTLK